MTITLQAVNELIQSLENAGELSIKERKYLELARAYQQLAAENAFILQLMHEQAGCFNAALIEGFHNLVMESGSEGLIDVYQRRLQPAIQCVPPTPATDRIVAGIKADGAKFIFQSILDNPAVTDLGSLVDWLEQHDNDSAAAVRAMREGAK
ncbi:hypothetical protein MC52_015900 [Klebsiella michiganensis]|uniref:hypothetical protein n=1 Tax=Klebsiella michiganensis TaxID=1134687 RepID=UPI000C9EAE5E|nr:hypothetical protein [Klebsiella michiganensis]PNO43938.1 hypothetical protein MC52_015900 [Klebsiella michiganensis]HED3412102.1 hypothetical protein [Klebsiella michiganensis]